MSDADDGWPDEPEEFDPDSLGPSAPGEEPAEFDADSLGPTAPSTPDPTEADPETARLFWKLVVVANVALAGLTVGPMIGFFLGNWDLGLQVFLVGLLALAYGLFRYRRFRAED